MLLQKCIAQGLSNACPPTVPNAFPSDCADPMRLWRDLHLVLRRLRLHGSSLLLDHHRLLLLHRERHRLPAMRIPRIAAYAA